MPWNVVEDDSACPVDRPVGLRKEGTNELVGCHATVTDAEAQQAALYAAEPEATSAGSTGGRGVEADNMNDESRSIDEVTYPVTARQRAHYEATEGVAELFGKFGPDNGPDGAHYVAASPFANEGLVCSNCVFYEGARGCEVMDAGPEGVDPNGICKLWIIPADLVGEAPADDAPVKDVPMDDVMAGDDVSSTSVRSSEHPTDNLLRALPVASAAQFRADNNGNTLFGHFAVFDTFTEIDSVHEGRFLERIAPGAFADTFAQRGDNIRVLYDHGKDPSIGNKPLGVPVALGEDERGAFYEVDLFDADYVNQLRPALEAGQLGASFRFSVTAENWHQPTERTAHNPQMLEERTITGVSLWEFGPVTFPAYESATAGLRSRTDDFISALADPAFAVRLADRVGPHVFNQMLAALPADGRSSETTTNAPADGRGKVTNNNDGGRLVASALTDIARRTGR